MGNSNPRLVKAEIESTHSVIREMLGKASESIVKIEDQNTRQAIISLKAAVDLIYTLTQVALGPYIQELDERIERIK